MNHRRSDAPKSHAFAFLALALAFVVATSGGAMHAIYRNGQIKIERKIYQAKHRIEEHRLDIQMIEVRKERLLDRYEIRDQLALLDSDLIAVTHGVVEIVRPLSELEAPPVAVRP